MEYLQVEFERFESLQICSVQVFNFLCCWMEEHAEVSINPDNAHNVLNIQVQKIENKKLGGVKKILAREAKKDKT